MREIDGVVIPPRGEEEILMAAITHQQLFQ
jgi:hypothetical protein